MKSIPGKHKQIPLRLGVLLLLGLSLTACGSSDSSGSSHSDKSNAERDSVFLAEFISPEGNYIDYGSIQSSGESLCYLSMEQNPATQLYEQCINLYSPESKSRTFAFLVWPKEQENIHLTEYIFDADANLYALAVSYSRNPPGSKDFLCKFDSQGNCLFARDITKRLRKDPESPTFISAVLLDSENRIYLQGNEEIWLFDGDGNAQGKISPDSSENGGTKWINAVFPSGDGKMYASYTSLDSPVRNYTLAELDFENQSMKTVSSDFPGNHEFAPGSALGLLMQSSVSLSAYDPVTNKEEFLLNWMDCNINGNNVLNFWEDENGRLLAVIDDSQNGGGEIALLTRTDASCRVQKETLVLAVLRDGYNYQPAVVDFNRSNDAYHIEIREYLNSENGSSLSREDALAKLCADLISGSCPDIIELTGLDTAWLAGKGAFEDLTPFLEQSSVVRKEDFVEEILRAYTFDKKLVSVPSLFFLETIIGDSSQVGGDSGWTLEELMALADAHPEAELFDGAARKEILEFILRYSEDIFVDKAAGQCNFDSDAFRNLLTFVNRFPEEPAFSPDQPSTPLRIQKGEVLLKEVWLYDFDSIQMDLEIFRGNASCIGFPSPDGSGRHSLTAAYAFAIPSGAEHKEGAWAFIESFLQKESTKENTPNQMGFPSVKRRLEAMIEDATTPEYILDENGQLWLDENGEPVVSGNSTTSSSDGWSYTYHTATREEVDMILSLLEGALLSDGGNSEILTIVTQEADAFFSGQKSPEEVSRIIQNRVSLYLKESF